MPKGGRTFGGRVADAIEDQFYIDKDSEYKAAEDLAVQ